MSILVTGGAGYIGSHTCVELLSAGYDIVLLDNFYNAKPDVVRYLRDLTGKQFPVYTTDMLYLPGLERVFREQPIDAVIHFAGLKAVGESVRIPMDYYHTNITGTLNLCRAMAQADCKRMVFSSSATVYGMNNPVPFREEYPTSATNPYGMTKVIIEQILRDIHTADPEWSIALLRYFNPIGAHSSGLLGEDPNGIPNNLLPYIGQVAVGKLPRLNIYGGDYDTPDGTGVRDYLHVVDLAVGHLRALEYLQDRTGAEAINLGTGTGYSVLQVVEAFQEASGIKIPYEIVDRRPGDIATCYADATLARELLGWEAKRTLLEMCADTWNFVNANQQRQ